MQKKKKELWEPFAEDSPKKSCTWCEHYVTGMWLERLLLIKYNNMLQ